MILETKEGELLPCPFCGSNAELVLHNIFFVRCKEDGESGCGCSQLGTTEKKDSMELWNKRTNIN